MSTSALLKVNVMYVVSWIDFGSAYLGTSLGRYNLPSRCLAMRRTFHTNTRKRQCCRPKGVPTPRPSAQVIETKTTSITHQIPNRTRS